MGEHTKQSEDERGLSISSGNPLYQHVVVAFLALVLAAAFWMSRPQWSPDMRLWRAIGDASFILFAMALAIGPLAQLSSGAVSLVKWRRSLGIWFALTAAIHGYFVWDGWARWSVLRLLGFEDLSGMGVDQLVLTDPGFGLANLIGIVALFWALVLAAISSDRAVRALGQRPWKHVQRYAYVVFYLVGLHAGYFLFLHYELSLRNLVFQNPPPPDPNWFRFWFLAIVGIVFILHWTAFAKRVYQHRASRK
jgi:sulfoxide reductase heme-binding subunit YedZ